MNKNILIGIIFKILNLNAFCLLSIALMQATEKNNLIVILLFLSIISSLALAPLILWKYKSLKLRANLKSFLLRAGLNVGGITTWVLSLHYLGANEATAISLLIPMLTSIFSTIILKEKIKVIEILALAISIIGALYVIWPKLYNKFTYIGVFFCIASCICWALHDIVCKKQAMQNIGFLLQSFKSVFFSAAICLLILPFIIRDINTIALFDSTFYIALASIISIFNIIFLFLAYKYSALVSLMPLSYTRFIFMCIYAYIIWGHVPNLHTITGACVVIIANLGLYYKLIADRRLVTMLPSS